MRASEKDEKRYKNYRNIRFSFILVSCNTSEGIFFVAAYTIKHAVFTKYVYICPMWLGSATFYVLFEDQLSCYLSRLQIAMRKTMTEFLR